MPPGCLCDCTHTPTFSRPSAAPLPRPLCVGTMSGAAPVLVCTSSLEQQVGPAGLSLSSMRVTEPLWRQNREAQTGRSVLNSELPYNIPCERGLRRNIGSRACSFTISSTLGAKTVALGR